MRKGFTLLELLIVVSIMALLISITVPSVNYARQQAKRAKCSANLHSIGQAIQAYISENHGFYPPMALMPTEETQGRPRMCDVLKSQVSRQGEVFHCPADRILKPEDYSPRPTAETWYQWQGSSYEPRLGSSFVENGRWILSKENQHLLDPARIVTWEDLVGSASEIDLVHDYEPFHGPPGKAGARMALYADFHVDALRQYEKDVTGR